MTEGKETKYAVRPSIAVFVGYFTAWSDADGRLNFRKDVYELDNKLANEIFVKIRQL
jgi:murein L,D-transpeptidase YcbB/YkuD